MKFSICYNFFKIWWETKDFSSLLRFWISICIIDIRICSHTLQRLRKLNPFDITNRRTLGKKKFPTFLKNPLCRWKFLFTFYLLRRTNFLSGIVGAKSIKKLCKTGESLRRNSKSSRHKLSLGKSNKNLRNSLKFSFIKMKFRVASPSPPGQQHRKMYGCEGERINQHFLKYVNRYLAPINYFPQKERIFPTYSGIPSEKELSCSSFFKYTSPCGGCYEKLSLFVCWLIEKILVSKNS